MGSFIERPTVTRRRGVTNPLGLNPALQENPATTPAASEAEISQVLVRKLTLHHSSHPFAPLREITQLHFSQWPDFGSIAAQDVLGLVEQSNSVTRIQQSPPPPQTYLHPHGVSGAPSNPLLPAPQGERPILVHCSAGCGRTGTFCVIDSVIDMLKRQRLAKTRQAVNNSDGEMDVDQPQWVFNDETDLIAKAVEDFRLQRLSMVQTLKQFVLCYEAIAEWWVKHTPDKFRPDHARRSSQG
jgi:protein-tyrosine phosphatase